MAVASPLRVARTVIAPAVRVVRTKTRLMPPSVSTYVWNTLNSLPGL